MKLIGKEERYTTVVFAVFQCSAGKLYLLVVYLFSRTGKTKILYSVQDPCPIMIGRQVNLMEKKEKESVLATDMPAEPGKAQSVCPMHWFGKEDISEDSFCIMRIWV